MFDLPIFLMTLQKVAFLLLFILVGYLLRRSGKLDHGAASTVSILTTFVFSPAYSISNLAENFTVENLGNNLKLVGFSVALLPFLIFSARLIARFLGRDLLEKHTFCYMDAFANTGYFGYPVIQGVFGEAMLAKFIVFCIPINMAIASYGYALFMSSGKGSLSVKRVLFSPPMLGTMIGCVLGLLQLPLPALLKNALQGAGACMSPSSMILAGLVMGAYPLKKLLSGVRPYLLGLIRLIAMPVLFGVPLYLVGVRGLYLFLALAITAMPSGMNIIVYPESLGHDASANAKICFVCTLMSLATMPVVLALAKTVSGLNL